MYCKMSQYMDAIQWDVAMTIFDAINYLFLETDMAEPNVYQFRDELTAPDPIHDYPDSLGEGRVPLVIDNGEYFFHFSPLPLSFSYL